MFLFSEYLSMWYRVLCISRGLACMLAIILNFSFWLEFWLLREFLIWLLCHYLRFFLFLLNLSCWYNLILISLLISRSLLMIWFDISSFKDLKSWLILLLRLDLWCLLFILTCFLCFRLVLDLLSSFLLKLFSLLLVLKSLLFNILATLASILFILLLSVVRLLILMLVLVRIFFVVWVLLRPSFATIALLLKFRLVLLIWNLSVLIFVEFSSKLASIILWIYSKVIYKELS